MAATRERSEYLTASATMRIIFFVSLAVLPSSLCHALLRESGGSADIREADLLELPYLLQSRVSCAIIKPSLGVFPVLPITKLSTLRQ